MNSQLLHTQRVRSRSEDRRARRGCGSRSSGAPTTAAGSLSVAADGPPRPQNVGQRHVSPSAAHRSAFRTVSRIIVTTSGEPILLPVGGRHPILNLGQRPLARYSDFDIPPSSSRTSPAYRTFQVQNGGKTTSGSGFYHKFGLLAPSFLLESGFVAVYRQVLSDFTLRAVDARYRQCHCTRCT